MTHYTIDIVSDTVCPWCHIGHARLRSAITTHLRANLTDTFSTHWHAYQLNPHFPAGQSTDKRGYYAAKFGASQTDAIFARLGAAGESCGIKFKFGGRTGNTRDSHRVIAMAGKMEGDAGEGQDKEGRGLQARVVEELFKDYFEREQDITDRGVLVAAAGRAEMDEESVKGMLEGEEYVKEVDAEVEKAKMEGVSGVPDFTVNGQCGISGGQEPAAFLQIFKRVKVLEERATASM